MAIKVGTAYVEVVGDFKSLNRQVSRLDRVSAQIGANFRRSMRSVSREATAAGRPVARLSNQVSGIGATSRATSRQLAADMRRLEQAADRTVRALQRVNRAQRTVQAQRQALAITTALGRPQRLPGVPASGSRGIGGFATSVAAAAAADAILSGKVRTTVPGSLGARGGGYSTYGLARSFGYGRAASSAAQGGALLSSGAMAAKTFGRAFVKALPGGMAAVGIEQILTKTISGDFESAGYTAGGALAGGVAGAFLGGPAGAAIGVGVGSFVGDKIGDWLGDSGEDAGNELAVDLAQGFVKRYGPALNAALRNKNLDALENLRDRLVNRLNASEKEGADPETLRPLRQSIKAMEGEIKRIRVPRSHVMKQMGLLRGGMITSFSSINSIFRSNARNINRSWDQGSSEWRKVSADNMRAAVRAIKAGMNQNVISVSAGNRRIKQLLRNAKLFEGRDPLGIAKGFKSSWKQAEGVNNAQLNRMIRDLKKMPKGAREKARETMIQMAAGLRKGGHLSQEEFSRIRDKLVRHFGKTKGMVSRDALKMVGKVAGYFGDLAGSVGTALENIGLNVNSMLSAFKVSNPLKFAVKAVKNLVGGIFDGKQKGGFIVPGKGDGDTFRTVVEAGSFVLNRRATRQLGFQRGGHVPVALEPGERVFSPREVRRVGLGNLEAANSAVPRFQRGGNVREPQITGREPLRSVGQGGVRQATQAAREYVKKKTASMGPASAAGAGKGRSYPGLSGDTDFAIALGQRLSALAKATVGHISVTSGWRSYAEQAALYAKYGSPRAAPPGQSNHEDGRAADISPERSAYGGAERRFGLHFPMSWEPWHIELLQTGGRVRKFSNGGFVGDINRIYAEHNSADGDWGGETLPSYVVAALAEAAGQALGIGVPGRTMEQVTRGESGSHERNSARPGATGIDPGGTKGLGLWMITTGYNDGLIAQYGGQAAMRNPVRNAAAMAKIYASQGLGAWYGTGSVTGTNTHYEGKYDIANALGGRTFAQTLGIAPRGGGGKTGKDRKGEFEAKLAAVAAEVSKAESLPVKKSSLWKLVKLWARLGIFDKAERMHILQAVQSAASATDVADSVSVLKNLARFTENHGEVTGKPAEDSNLIESIAAAQSKGQEKRKKRIKEQRQRVKAMQTKAQEKIAKRASFEDLVNAIASLRKQAETQETIAGEVAALEPENLTEAYVSLERDAYQKQLTNLRDWRNKVVGARGYAATEIERFKQQIEAIKALKVETDPEKVKAGDPIVAPHAVANDPIGSKGKGKKGKGKLLGGIVEYLSKGGKPGVGKGHLVGPHLHQGHPAGRPRGVGEAEAVGKAKGPGPQAYEKQKFRIPLLEQAIRDAEALRNETWLPELEEISPFSIEGIIDSIPSEPVPGAFGGRIFELQNTIRSLGLKTEDTDKSAEEAAYYREKLMQAEQRNIVRGIEESVFASMGPVGGFQLGGRIGLMPPYAGKAHTGAVVPGPPGQERTMVVKSGEGIFTPEQMAALGGGGEIGPVRVNVNGDIVSSHPDPVEVLLGDRRLVAEIRKVTGRDNRRQVRGAGRGLATPGVFSR